MRYTKYDTHGAIHWDWLDESGNGYRDLVSNVLRYFVPYRGTILDVGSGDGAVDRLLVDLGFTVIGVEPEPRGVAISQERVPEMRVIESTIEEANVPPTDYLISINTIEHLDNPNRMVELMYNVDDFGIIVTDNAEREHHDEFHTREFTMRELADLFRDFSHEPINTGNPAFIGLKIWN